MAASQAYRDWLAAKKPYTLIRPAAALVRNVARHGITVYHYPNGAHLTATVPEDHTPFSATGWPAANKRWKARGVDIMPRSDSYAHRKENADIARRIIADRNAGVPAVMWIKYLNWTDESGVCRQERWTPNHTTRSSTDKGHIHVSGRSDADDDDRADGYDPLFTSPAMTGDDVMGTWTEAITQNAGRDYLTEQQRDTVLAIAAGGAADANHKLDQVIAAQAADKARDEATLAAIKALTVGGNGDVVVAAINAVGAKVHDEVAELQRLLGESRDRELALQEELAATRAAAEANLSPIERASLGDKA